MKKLKDLCVSFDLAKLILEKEIIDPNYRSWYCWTSTEKTKDPFIIESYKGWWPDAYGGDFQVAPMLSELIELMPKLIKVRGISYQIRLDLTNPMAVAGYFKIGTSIPLAFGDQRDRNLAFCMNYSSLRALEDIFTVLLNNKEDWLEA